MESLHSGYFWDKCPGNRGVLISGLNLYYNAQFGAFFLSVLNTGVSSFQGVLNRGVSLYCGIVPLNE